MRKRTHTQKILPDTAMLWYLTALAGLLLFCLIPILPTESRQIDPLSAQDDMPGAELADTDGDIAVGMQSDSPTSDPLPVFLMQGDCGADVYRLQSQLTVLGYDPGDCTGVYTKETASAVRRFQLDCGWIGDGVCTAAVSHAAAYLSGEGYVPASAVSEEAVCAALAEAGCWNPAGDAAADRLPQDIRMRNALILFQRTHGLCGSGTTDYATLCALGLGGEIFPRGSAETEAAAAAAVFDLRCRLLAEALAEYVLRYPAAYDLYTLTACAAVLCNRTADAGFPDSFDAVCDGGLALHGTPYTGDVSGTAVISRRAHDLLLLRAAEDALRAHLSGSGCDLSRGALYVIPAADVLPADAEICLFIRNFVFFR